MNHSSREFSRLTLWRPKSIWRKSGKQPIFYVLFVLFMTDFSEIVFALLSAHSDGSLYRKYKRLCKK